MGCVFINCESLLSLDLSSWDTSKVISAMSMFSQCTSLQSLDLSNFDFSNLRSGNNYRGWIFDNCTSLNFIRCKQSFKDWCITNQDTIKLPTQMRAGGTGIWDILDLDATLASDAIVTYINSIPKTALQLDEVPALHFPAEWLTTLGDNTTCVAELDMAGFDVYFGETLWVNPNKTAIDSIKVYSGEEVIKESTVGGVIDIDSSTVTATKWVLDFKNGETVIDSCSAHSIYSNQLAPNKYDGNLCSVNIGQDTESPDDPYITVPAVLKVLTYNSEGNKQITTININ